MGLTALKVEDLPHGTRHVNIKQRDQLIDKNSIVREFDWDIIFLKELYQWSSA